MAKKGLLPPIHLHRTYCLAITMEGFRIAEKWDPTEHFPSHNARLYQLLLKLTRTKDVLAVSIARRMEYGWNIVDPVLPTGYLGERMDEVPRWFYA